MHFLLDESADARLLRYLREAGHDAASVLALLPAGAADRDVLEVARADGRTLITRDHDVGEMIARQRIPHAGVILLRLHAKSLAATQVALACVLDQFPNEVNQFSSSPMPASVCGVRGVSYEFVPARNATVTPSPPS